jgi:hypothetical protein
VERERPWFARVAAGLASSLMALAFLALLLDVGLRLVHRSNDPRVLVYPVRGNGINGFGAPGFGREIPRGTFRILALGASAFVTRDFHGQFERLMNEAPEFRARGLAVDVVTAGVPAHMSYDSLWKYRYWYAGYDFDLVIFYHGINDARANNYPREVFRSDYTQFPYYRQYAPVFDWIERHPWLSRSFAASFVRSLGARAWVRLAPAFQREAPYNDPLHDPWREEGGDVKTAPVFAANLEAVLEMARERGQRVMLATYAYYVPADYTNERFLAHETDYAFAPESVAIEVWGYSHHVAAAIEAHNRVVREAAGRHPEVIFVDMERLLPKDGAHFIDVCHWTDLGRERFAQGVLEALRTREAEIFGRALARR